MNKVCIVFDKTYVENHTDRGEALNEKIEFLTKLGYEVDLMPLMGAESLNKEKGKDEAIEHYDFTVMNEFMELVKNGHTIVAQKDTTVVCAFLWRFGIEACSITELVKGFSFKELIENNVTPAEYEKYVSSTCGLPHIIDIVADKMPLFGHKGAAVEESV